MGRPAVGVLILGMARSGTSAVAAMFVSAGFYAGRDGDLMGPHESNPVGHFENLRVYRLNEEILDALRGSWFAPPAEQAQVEARAWAAAKLEQVLGELLEEADGAPVVLKDPRIGVMMPLWAPVIGDRLHPVLVIRDPLEIALSLSLRDRTPLPFGLAAWEMHMTALMRGLAGRVVTVVPYHELLQSPKLANVTVSSVTARLAKGCAGEVRASAAAKAVQPNLRNHLRERDHDQQLTVRQQKLWRFLASLEPGEQAIAVPKKLLSVSASAGSSVRAERERRELREVLDTQQRQLAERAAIHDEAERRWTGERGELIRQQEQYTRERAELARREEEHKAQSAELIRQCEDLVRELGSAQTGIELLRGERAREQTRAEAAEAMVDVLASSRSWRLTAPLRACVRKLRAVLGLRTKRRRQSRTEFGAAARPTSGR
jgi:hypothetical protein